MVNLPEVEKKNDTMVQRCNGKTLLGVASSLRRVKSKRPRLQGKETPTKNYHFLHMFFPFV